MMCSCCCSNTHVEEVSVVVHNVCCAHGLSFLCGARAEHSIPDSDLIHTAGNQAVSRILAPVSAVKPDRYDSSFLMDLRP
jgi:hypothetical protein